MKTVADTLGVARSNLAAPPPRPKRRGRPPADETELLQAVRVVIKGLQSYGYRRVWAVLSTHPVRGAAFQAATA